MLPNTLRPFLHEMSSMSDTKPTPSIDALFRAKNRQLAVCGIDLLRDENPMTLRQLFYRLISAGRLANSQKEYKRLGNVLKTLREERLVPRSWLVDHVRSTLKPSSWSGLADFADTVRGAYRKNFWASLPAHVEVLVEKDAVAGTIQPVTEEFDVSLRVCRGYASVSFAGEIADLWRRIRKPIYAYYLGDFDPSGFDIERDLSEKLHNYSQRQFHWHRLGVREEDFSSHGLIRLPVKTKDKRAKGFLNVYGNRCAEIDALPPTELRNRVREAILSHVDHAAWERLQNIERLEQESINAALLNLGAAA